MEWPPLEMPWEKKAELTQFPWTVRPPDPPSPDRLAEGMPPLQPLEPLEPIMPEYAGELDINQVAGDLGLDLGRTEKVAEPKRDPEVVEVEDKTASAGEVRCGECGWENSFFPDQRSFEKASGQGTYLKWPTKDDFAADPDPKCASCQEPLTAQDVY